MGTALALALVELSGLGQTASALSSLADKGFVLFCLGVFSVCTGDIRGFIQPMFELVLVALQQMPTRPSELRALSGLPILL